MYVNIYIYIYIYMCVYSICTHIYIYIHVDETLVDADQGGRGTNQMTLPCGRYSSKMGILQQGKIR